MIRTKHKTSPFNLRKTRNPTFMIRTEHETTHLLFEQNPNPKIYYSDRTRNLIFPIRTTPNIHISYSHNTRTPTFHIRTIKQNPLFLTRAKTQARLNYSRISTRTRGINSACWKTLLEVIKL